MAPSRLILDTNLYLNFLLAPDPNGSATAFILYAAADGIIDLILPDDVIAELGVVVAERPHLRKRVTRADLDALIAWLIGFASSVPAFEGEPPPMVRDQKDDYLVALAVLHAADFLVSRDKDLLVLHDVLGIRIVHPVEVVAMLRRLASE